MPNDEAPYFSRQAFDAVIFDLDGVITRTARTHACAWKAAFDEFLQRDAARNNIPFQPFDTDSDYRRYVDGKPRYEGSASFLAARHIALPLGEPDDPPERETVCGLANKKNQVFLELVKQHGVDVYASTVELIRRLREHGVKTAVVSSSKSTVPILEAVGITELFDVKVDGADAARLGLKGKPAPETFLEAARRLKVEPKRAAVVEDAIAGVQAGAAGGFGSVIGVDRTKHPQALKDAGADVVVEDLARLGLP